MKNEIKKLLYRNKPIATLFDIDGINNIRQYSCDILTKDGDKVTVYFTIPEEESQNFKKEMESHLLIRWLHFTRIVFK